MPFMYMTRAQVKGKFDSLTAEKLLAECKCYKMADTKQLEYLVPVLQGASTLSQNISSNTTITMMMTMMGMTMIMMVVIMMVMMMIDGEGDGG